MYSAVQNYLKAVGIDAELEPIQVGRQNELVMGGKWEGMLQAAQSNIDVLSMLNEMYTASREVCQHGGAARLFASD